VKQFGQLMICLGRFKDCRGFAREELNERLNGG
jgi:hypothetical protein